MAGSTKRMVGKGSTLAYSEDTGPGPYTYTTLLDVVSANPALSVGEVEDVTLASDFESYLPTLPSGECGFVVRYKPGDAGVKKLQAYSITPQIVHWKLTAPDGSFMLFDGFVKGFTKTYENREIINAEVPMRLTTKPVFTEAA